MTRIRGEHGIAMMELLVAMFVIAALMLCASPLFASVRRASANNAMRANSASIARVLARYNEDYPVIPARDVWPVPASCATGGCWDPLIRRAGTASFPDRAPGTGPGTTWTATSWLDPRRGLVSPGGKRYLGEWPESPYPGAFVVARGAAPAPYAGLVVVQRTPGGPYGRPMGSFRVTGYGTARDGAPVPIYRRTFGAVPVAGFDCGHGGGAPPCSGA